MVRLEEAVQLVLEKMLPVKEVQNMVLAEAQGRILAEDIIAEMDQPPFARSPLDGYALRSADVSSASKQRPVLLHVVDEIHAGQVSGKTVGKGECVRIMTGAPIPDGADTVIRQEDTDYSGTDPADQPENETGRTVQIFAAGRKHQNYCFAGEDYKAGDVLLKAGTGIGMAQMGVLAGLGREKVTVFRKPRVLLITTGDELTEPGNAPAPGKIYNSNRYLLEAALRAYGAEVIRYAHAGDDASACAEIIRSAAAEADLAVTTGGVSVGKKDIMHEVMRVPEAERVFWKVQMKPGSPLLFGIWNREAQPPLPVLCLSGNPYAAFVSMELILRPAVNKLSGALPLKTLRIPAVLQTDFGKASPNRRFVRGYFDGTGVTVKEHGGNGALLALAVSNCLIDIPAGSGPVMAGDTVTVQMLL